MSPEEFNTLVNCAAIVINVFFIGFMIWFIKDQIKEIKELKKIEKRLDEQIKNRNKS